MIKNGFIFYTLTSLFSLIHHSYATIAYRALHDKLGISRGGMLQNRDVMPITAGADNACGGTPN